MTATDRSGIPTRWHLETIQTRRATHGIGGGAGVPTFEGTEVARQGDVTLYYTEWQTAHRMRDEFFIYVVDHALEAPTLWIVRDPVGKGIRPVEKVVEYRVTAEHLRAATDLTAE